jgi:hypothetical protein
MVGNSQRTLLRQFLGKGMPGVESRMAKFAVPDGLSRKSLEIYRELARRAVAEGIDKGGVQAVRLKLIDQALKVVP